MEKLTKSSIDFYGDLKSIFSSIHSYVILYASTVLTQLGIYFIAYLMICYGAYIVSTLFRHLFSRSKYFDDSAKRILIVTAHPDDECMFFGPLIVRMIKSNKRIYILCLSSGDSRNEGHMRKYELYNSCNVLGINTENVFLCCSTLRMDGQQYMWKSDAIAGLIYDYVDSLEIDTVVTFDKHGVSGHQNHCALFRAVSFLSLRNWLPPTCRIFLLDTINIVRKYSSLMDCGLSLYMSENTFVLSFFEHGLLKKAMSKHKTQFVWFRKLYMCFSRYTYINTFYELPRYLDVSVEQQRHSD